ncbi:response regulator [Euryarchaeota archaeon]|nr:response regulator [Euryarchaeota archaeon]|tara:strand:- start:63068 stop:63679 length:612 start_codon:yes stop_codon:yes gene_type:complete
MPSDTEKIALIAISNPITSGRINTIMKQKGWSSKIHSDGDEAVDSFVQLKPSIVFISLNLSTINGHIAALEMREINHEARIVFVSSKTRIKKVQDAAFSSGAVGIITTPLTLSKVDNIWHDIFSEIPDAPGLADLDELYPVIPIQQPPLLPMAPPLPISSIESMNVEPKKKEKNILRNLKISILIISGTIIIISSLIFFDFPN